MDTLLRREKKTFNFCNKPCIFTNPATFSVINFFNPPVTLCFLKVALLLYVSVLKSSRLVQTEWEKLEIRSLRSASKHVACVSRVRRTYKGKVFVCSFILLFAHVKFEPKLFDPCKKAILNFDNSVGLPSRYLYIIKE